MGLEGSPSGPAQRSEMQKQRNKREKFDIVIVGAGHAGCEAALAASRMGCKVLLLTGNSERIAHMPCNPSVGGIGKGHLVKEIDALGGQMGKNTDESMIQIKTLNKSRGPAVQALRAQTDKRLYESNMKQVLEREENLFLVESIVSEICVEGGQVGSIKTEAGGRYFTKIVLVATGTFLSGRVIIGDISFPAGRMGEFSAENLSLSLKKMGLELRKLQTATPPRIDWQTINFSKMVIQPGDKKPLSFSAETTMNPKEQLPCYLTYTNEQTHKTIKDFLHLSPIKTGIVKSHGPRNCPSIDRKVMNFPEKKQHPVFIEPEGRETQEAYLQGLTTALPVEAQINVVRATPGLEKAEIVRPGYAVEYDYLLPTQLKPTLETKTINGLFLAGQVIGTTGYEEAAALGLMAGINAALKVKGETPLILDRSEAYIGVLIDDLVTKELSEPYRMYTSRAEHRLILRSDNADLRLSQIGPKLGLISDERMRRVSAKREAIQKELEGTKKTMVFPEKSTNEALTKIGSSPIKNPVSLANLLRRPEVSYHHLEKLCPEAFARWRSDDVVWDEVRRHVEMEVKYEGYVRRQMEQVERHRRAEKRIISDDIDYHEMSGLSFRAREQLSKIKPRSLGQASRVSGVSPADVVALMIYLEQKTRSEKRT